MKFRGKDTQEGCSYSSVKVDVNLEGTSGDIKFPYRLWLVPSTKRLMAMLYASLFIVDWCGHNSKGFGIKPSAIVTRYDNEEEGWWDGSHDTKHPKEYTIHNGGQLAPLNDNGLSFFGKLLSVEEVAHHAILISRHVERVERWRWELIASGTAANRVPSARMASSTRFGRRVSWQRRVQHTWRRYANRQHRLTVIILTLRLQKKKEENQLLISSIWIPKTDHIHATEAIRSLDTILINIYLR